MKQKNYSSDYQKSSQIKIAIDRRVKAAKRQKKKRMERAKIEQSWGGLYD